jgi:hypothetical protein
MAKVPTPISVFSCSRAAFVIATALPLFAHAELVIEPVFNRVPGSGPAENNFPIYDPEFLVDGVAYFTIDEPGEIQSYASGDPRDPFLDEFHVWNNTRYRIDGFTLRIIGTATETENPGSIVRGPKDAVFGDVDGDGQIGSSDIFSSIVVSADGKEIQYTGGLIPVGGRFTDIHLAMSDNPPDFAGIDSFFTGVLVPEPSGIGLGFLATITALLGWIHCRPRRETPAAHRHV